MFKINFSFKCEKYTESYRSRNGLGSHYAEEHSDIPVPRIESKIYKCRKCNKEWAVRDEAKEHHEMEHGKKFVRFDVYPNEKRALDSFMKDYYSNPYSSDDFQEDESGISEFSDTDNFETEREG
ncbi:unnamed protein product [Caenorhabditis nigoni]